MTSGRVSFLSRRAHRLDQLEARLDADVGGDQRLLEAFADIVEPSRCRLSRRGCARADSRACGAVPIRFVRALSAEPAPRRWWRLMGSASTTGSAAASRPAAASTGSATRLLCFFGPASTTAGFDGRLGRRSPAAAADGASRGARGGRARRSISAVGRNFGRESRATPARRRARASEPAPLARAEFDQNRENERLRIWLAATIRTRRSRTDR